MDLGHAVSLTHTRIFTLTYIYYFNCLYRLKNIEALVKLVEFSFASLLPSEMLSLEKLHSTRDDKVIRNSVAALFNHHETMINAIYDTAKEISFIKKNLYLYYHKEYNSNAELYNLNKQVQLSAGRLWVLSGMCLLEIFSAISPVDPLQKAKVQIECSKTEVKYFIFVLLNHYLLITYYLNTLILENQTKK